MPLGVRERILAIRLMEKIAANPSAAERLGIIVEYDRHNVQKEINADKADKA